MRRDCLLVLGFACIYEHGVLFLALGVGFGVGISNMLCVSLWLILLLQ